MLNFGNAPAMRNNPRPGVFGSIGSEFRLSSATEMRLSLWLRGQIGVGLVVALLDPLFAT